MSSRSEKNKKMRAKREKWEAETKERGQSFLAKEQARRNSEREKAEQARKDRAIAKSKRLAKEHKRQKQGVQKHRPMQKGRSTLAKMAGQEGS